MPDDRRSGRGGGPNHAVGAPGKDDPIPQEKAGKDTLDRRSYLTLMGGAVGLGGSLSLTSSATGATESREGRDSRNAATEEGGEQIQESTGDRGGLGTDEPVIGANLNGRPRLLEDNLDLIDASDTTWVRAFLDVRKKHASGRRPEDDPDVVALGRAAREKDCKLIISLKWDFKASWGDKKPMAVPRPDSDDEAALCECASEYLEAIGAPIDVIVLGNEPMWETRSEDISVNDPPVVSFTRTVKDHLIEHGNHGDPTYLVGAFNKTHSRMTRLVQFSEFHRGLFELVRTDADIDGVDLHLHYEDLAQAEQALSVVREEIPDGTITATEFSPVWRYDRFTDIPIGKTEAGSRFATEHDLSHEMTAAEYFQYAKSHPRPQAEMAAFYEAMPWYNTDHIADIHGLFDQYDVAVGTIGFLQGLGMRHTDWTRGWTPFHINFLFQPALMRTDGGIEQTANPHYLDDYRAVASPGERDSTATEDRGQGCRSDSELSSYLCRAKRRYFGRLFRGDSNSV